MQSGAIGLRSYFLLRIWRIAPLHWATAFLFIAWLGLWGDGVPGPGTIILNLLLLHAWAPDADVHYALNGPSWSLSDELFFYAVFPWIVRAPTRILAPALTVAMGAITAIAVLTIVRQTKYSATLEWFFYVAPQVRLVDFVAGMLLYRVYCLSHGRRWAGTMAEMAVTLAIPAAMIGFSFAAVPMPIRWQVAYLPLMMAAVLIFAHGKGAISRVCQGRWPMLLGEASFALYLTHRPVIALAYRLWGGEPGCDMVLAMALPPFCIALSIMVFLLLERPLLRHLRQAAWTHDADRERMKPWRPS